MEVLCIKNTYKLTEIRIMVPLEWQKINSGGKIGKNVRGGFNIFRPLVLHPLIFFVTPIAQ